jgi:fatty-acid desaturase
MAKRRAGGFGKAGVSRRVEPGARYVSAFGDKGKLALATGLGLTVGYHRLFSHRAFATRPAVSVALLILGSMAGRGPMISWVAMHRRHHECSDREGNLHSPNMHGLTPMQRLRGWLHAHWTTIITLFRTRRRSG